MRSFLVVRRSFLVVRRSFLVVREEFFSIAKGERRGEGGFS